MRCLFVWDNVDKGPESLLGQQSKDCDIVSHFSFVKRFSFVEVENAVICAWVECLSESIDC